MDGRCATNSNPNAKHDRQCLDMCGICGFVIHNKTDAQDYNGILHQMADVLAHRGPDTGGHYFLNNGNCVIGLGHRRLSIIDLSKAANQPMGNEDNSVIVIYNGEIYNYKDLTRDLKANGHKFRSQSDTEAIVHLYEDSDKQCVGRLDGMFAFALWEKEKKRLFLARDRMGIKPLFYALIAGNFYFASEIKSLLMIPEISRKLDYKSLDSYFTYGYIPGSKTIFHDIQKLPPASYLVFENRQIKIQPYWSIEYLPKHNMSEKKLTDGLFDRFSHSVRRHLVSDVPLGAFLSGGIDSSIVVALMNIVGKQSVNTFSIGYDSEGKDELEYAALVAGHCKTNHNEFRIKPEMTRILPELLWHLDEPFFDNSIIPTWYISRFAREQVKVVLSGDGGDEFFGGYEWTRRHQFNEAFKQWPGLIRIFLERFSGKIHPEDEYSTSVVQKYRRLVSDLTADVEKGFCRRTTVSYPFRQMLYSRELKNRLKNYNASSYQQQLFSNACVSDIREKMLYVDTMSFLPYDCLFKVDRMSMAHGLEVRVPFLDKELVEFAAKIPFEYKIRGLTSKYILKKAMIPYLPKKIFRQRKQGFTIPISSWLKGKLRVPAKNILLSNSLAQRGLFEKKCLKWMLKEHSKGKQELGHRIWSIVIFEIWARLYLDEKITSKPDFPLKEMLG